MLSPYYVFLCRPEMYCTSRPITHIRPKSFMTLMAIALVVEVTCEVETPFLQCGFGVEWSQIAQKRTGVRT